MKNKILLSALCFCFLISIKSHAQLQKGFNIDLVTFDPWYIHSLNDDSLIIIDPQNKKQALQLTSVTKGKVLNSHGIGRGPGEISSKGDKIINVIGNTITVWDSGSRQILKYDRSLNYKTSILPNVPAIYATLLNDSLVYVSTQVNANDFLHLYSVNGRDLSAEAVRKYVTEVDKKLKPLNENYLLKQGPFLVDDGALFMGFDYSSLIVKASPDSILYVTDKPTNIPLPQYEAISSDGNTRIQSAPDITEYPPATLDLKVDKNFMYVLHSGKEFGGNRLKNVWLAATGKLQEKIESLQYSKTIHIYEKDTGNYLKKWILPQEAKKIAVSKNYLFTLSVDDENLPIIVAYKKEPIN